MSERWETQLSRLKIMAADNGVLSEKDREAVKEALRRIPENGPAVQGLRHSRAMGQQICVGNYPR